MILNKARIIATPECPRGCWYCSNNFTNIKHSMIPLGTLHELSFYDEIIITGGEPSLFPDKLINLTERIRLINSRARYYLYMSTYTSLGWAGELIHIFDGIQYTIHDKFTADDIEKFMAFQNLIRDSSNKSFRLALSPTINEPIGIIPAMWSMIKVKKWLTNEQLPHPPDREVLYSLAKSLWDGD